MANVQITKERLKNWKMARWRCRTDLEYLCRFVLNYTAVDREVHGPVIDLLQKFPLPDPKTKEFWDNDSWDGTKFNYRPLTPMPRLPGGRRRLILDPRGHLKTTINAQAHTIQWILNYPDTAIAIWQSNLEKAQMILKEVKHHFQFNEKLREWFPELCPQKNPADFGTKDQFTIPGRSVDVSRREPTVMVLSIEKGTAGLHFDVMKFSDVVEPENVKTKERIDDVKTSFRMAKNLLVSPPYWIDVEGTRYHHADLYGDLIRQWQEEELQGVTHEYQVHIRGVFRKVHPNDRPVTYTPNDFNLPDLIVDGHKVPLWPLDRDGMPRFPLKDLEAGAREDPYMHSCQQLNQPIGGIDGVEIFPLEQTKFISKANFRQNIRVVSTTMTIDTAETKNARSNFSAIVVACWDQFGRCYIRDIIHGKWLPNELIDKIFEANKKYRPSFIKIEKTSFVSGLMAGITREMDLKGEYLPIELVPRDNQQAKEERIKNTLQPYHANHLLRFVQPEEDPKKQSDEDKRHAKALAHCMVEMKTFPIGMTDDILDALADQFQGKEWFGREQPRSEPENDFDAASNAAWAKLLGFEELEEATGEWKTINLPH